MSAPTHTPSQITLVLLGALLLGVASVLDWSRVTAVRHTRPVALCPNYDTLVVHDPHWNQAERRRSRDRIELAPDSCRSTLSGTP